MRHKSYPSFHWRTREEVFQLKLIYNTQNMEFDDYYYMQHALHLAAQGAKRGEVPVGAVLVKDNQIIAEAYNQPISLCDPSAHAEMLVIREAAKRLNNYRLLNTTLYVTLEPCLMCQGVISHARIKRLVFGARDVEKKTGHLVITDQGILAEECGVILKNFFKEKRG